MHSELGKIIAVHPTSPAFLQRAAVVAALAFIFFLATLIFYLVWGNFLYFMLATAFLIVQLFTMTGWWMQKRNAVRIFANGIVFKKTELEWHEIASVEHEPNCALVINTKAGRTIAIPRSIHGLGALARHVREMSTDPPSTLNESR